MVPMMPQGVGGGHLLGILVFVVYEVFSLFDSNANHVFISGHFQIQLVQWRPIALPDNYIEQASPEEQLAIAGLTGHHIAATVLSLLGRNREALLLMQ
ncbi:putative 1-deoxy-D-xylulose-5-phosphate synthase, chloroplastic [Vitis vinifera]|uniref:Putative 1-deoxy-D-xylulose-5-phosphate synthase, chloroplastic n=1 Tax=Vitis vinifera TaxID=29760 RepID=A0A438KF37_VITVI|nr:putative 1-deoxy-D-xylulose-5-phosphate synthase, chloroplastic [Vitis vinifera]